MYNYPTIPKLRQTNLDKDTQFITASEILHEVKNELRVYFERSVLDDSYFYPVIRSCLSKLGAKVYPVNETVIWISNYQAYLPKDFHKLLLAIGCFDYIIKSTPNENPQLYDVKETQEDYLISKPSYTCLDECGENFYVIQRFDTFEVTFRDYGHLSITESSYPHCASNCFNKQILGQEQIEIKNGKIYAGFETGSVFISYLQKLEKEDEDGVDLIIPDFAPIRDWVKAACIKKGFEVMYYNNDGDVQQRLNYAKNELTVLEQNARSFARMVEFRELYDIRKVFFSRYNKFEHVIYGNPRYMRYPINVRT